MRNLLIATNGVRNVIDRVVKVIRRVCAEFPRDVCELACATITANELQWGAPT